MPHDLPRWLRRVLRAGRPRARTDLSRGSAWRVLTPVAFLGAGALMVTSAIDSGGTDLRASRYDDLAGLAQTETQRVKELRAQVEGMQDQVDQLTGEVHSSTLTKLQQRNAVQSMPAGLRSVQGPGVTVELNDAPKSVQDSAGSQVANAIVHQQDIQAVVNAMWAGGAEAVTLQGQRVVSTTGIKCVGNTVLLHGVTYSPPYVISAIGDPSKLEATLTTNPYIQAYLQAVAEWQLGWQMTTEHRVVAPAYDGSIDLRYARPMGTK